MKYYLTGNFQYDLGIFGLKRLLEYFNEPFKTDGNYYIETDKKPEEILELSLLKLIIDKKAGYFKEKALNAIEKDKKKFIDSNIKKKINELREEALSVSPFTDSLKNCIGKFSEAIFEQIRMVGNGKFNIDKSYIEDIVWASAVRLLGRILHNFQSDNTVRGKASFNKAIENLYKGVEKDKLCSFCKQKKGKEINRSSLFLAPASLNSSWFNEFQIFICPYCLASQFTIFNSLNFSGKSNREAIAVYCSNFSDFESLNSIIRFQQSDGNDIAAITWNIIEYKKEMLKKQAVINDLQIIEFFIDGQKPDLMFYIIDRLTIQKFINVKEILDNLYNKKNKKLYGMIKSGNGYHTINLAKELLYYFSNNIPLFNLINRYINYVILAEIGRQKADAKLIAPNKVLVKGFYPDIFLDILKIDFKLKGGEKMELLDTFKTFGQRLRGLIIKSLKQDGQSISWNTVNNKIIALSNRLLKSSKGSFEQFIAVLVQTLISYNMSLTNEEMSMINKDNYKEVATVIALALNTRKAKEEEKLQDMSDKTDNGNNKQQELPARKF